MVESALKSCMKTKKVCWKSPINHPSVMNHFNVKEEENTQPV